MPELPEVETTRRGIAAHAIGASVTAVHIHNQKLRWPVPDDLELRLKKQKIVSVTRRGKYLLFAIGKEVLIVHLGMSGSLRLVDSREVLRKHDHIEFRLSNGYWLRYHDPRRFGCVLIAEEPLEKHPLLANLGPEPLLEAFNAEYLKHKCRNKKIAIKLLIMDSKVVVGVGNIYANEALFRAGIRPRKAAGKLTFKQVEGLVASIKEVLGLAIEQGGTTLRDFVNGSGEPGYFAQKLLVYGRQGESCYSCTSQLKGIIVGQRATVYCPRCQT